MGKIAERLKNGIITENPTFVQMLGMCPTLAVTSSAINGLGMGLTTMVILTMSNFMISLLRKLIPDKVRIPAYIVIIASFVTIVQFVLQAYIPSLNDSLGIFIPLIVVNCIILGRAESYASKNPVIPSIFDGIGMGLGFTVGLTTIGIIREILGSGSIFGFSFVKAVENFAESHASDKVFQILSDQGLFQPASIFVSAPGAFLVLAFIIAFINRRHIKKAKKTGEGRDMQTGRLRKLCKCHVCRQGKGGVGYEHYFISDIRCSCEQCNPEPVHGYLSIFRSIKESKHSSRYGRCGYLRYDDCFGGDKCDLSFRACAT